MPCMDRDSNHEAILEQNKKRKNQAIKLKKWLSKNLNAPEIMQATGNTNLSRQLANLKRPSGNSVTFAQLAGKEADIEESKLCHAITNYGIEKFEKFIKTFPITNKTASELYLWWRKHKKLDQKRIDNENETRRKRLLDKAETKINQMTTQELQNFTKET